MKLFKKTALLLAGLLLFSFSAFAQGQQAPEPLNPEDITEEQLESFSVISAEIQVFQKEANTKAQKVVEDAGMSFDRFQEIAMKSRNPKMADSLTLTEEEKKQMQKIQPELMKINTSMQQDLIKLIQDEDMTPQEFQQIAQAIQQNPELQERLKALDEEN